MLSKETMTKLIEKLSNSLNGEESTDLIDKIYDSRIDDIDIIVSKDSIYKENLEKLKNKENEIIKISKTLYEYIEMKDEYLACSNELYYKIGLKDGLAVLLSAMEGDDLKYTIQHI
jgi:hypothetical protein